MQNASTMIKAKIMKTRIVKDAVFSKILNDKKLRDILIVTTGLRDSGVCSFARRKSQTKVTNIDIITAIKNYTKWTDDDIFESDK